MKAARAGLFQDGPFQPLTHPSALCLHQLMIGHSPSVSHLFEMVFAQYIRHPDSKSLAPDGTRCKADSHGLLTRYPISESGFHLIGKETERG